MWGTLDPKFKAMQVVCNSRYTLWGPKVPQNTKINGVKVGRILRLEPPLVALALNVNIETKFCISFGKAFLNTIINESLSLLGLSRTIYTTDILNC